MYRSILLAIFLFSFCSCKNDSLTENQVLPKLESALLVYVPKQYEVGNSLIFKNEKGEEIKLNIGTGTTSNPETNQPLSIRKSIGGMIRDERISITLDVHKNYLKEGEDYLTFGILTFGNNNNSDLTSERKKGSPFKTIPNYSANRASLAQTTENSLTIQEDEILCLPGSFENNNINFEYEMCVAKNIGIYSFTVNDELWSFVKIVADPS